jgi:hypothetical protein
MPKKNRNTRGGGFNDARDRVKAGVRTIAKEFGVELDPSDYTMHWKDANADHPKDVYIPKSKVFEFIMGMDDRARKTPARKGKA